PLTLALGVLAWKFGPSGLNLIPAMATNAVYAGLIALYLCQLMDAWRINAPVLRGEPVPAIHRYKFRQVAVLSLVYFVTFGSELAIEHHGKEHGTGVRGACHVLLLAVRQCRQRRRLRHAAADQAPAHRSDRGHCGRLGQ